MIECKMWDRCETHREGALIRSRNFFKARDNFGLKACCTRIINENKKLFSQNIFHCRIFTITPA